MYYLRVVAGRLLRVFPAAIDSNALIIKIYTLRRHIVDKKRYQYTADYHKAKVVVLLQAQEIDNIMSTQV